MSPLLTQLLLVLTPLSVAWALAPALRKNTAATFKLVLISMTYFGIWSSEHWGPHLPVNLRVTLSIGLLGASLVLCLRTLAIPSLSQRVMEITLGLTLLISAGALTTLGNHGPLLSGAVGLLVGTSAVVLGLIFDIEIQWRRKLDESTGGGVHFIFPRHSSLILVGMLLFGSTPGSLLFLIEDILLHDLASEVSTAAAGLTIMVTALSSIAMYRSYTQIFVGRSLYDMPEHLRKNPSRWLGILVLLFILAGLSPRLFLGH